jgi:hypothetical protein
MKDISILIERSMCPDNITACFQNLLDGLEFMNRLSGRGNDQAGEYIRLSNDPSFKLIAPIKPVTFGCSTLDIGS